LKTTVDTPLIMSLKPCPAWPESRVREAVPEEITIVDFLRADHIPPEDRLWVAVHPDFCTDSLMRIFAGDCAERALISERDAGRDPDPRSWEAVAVARRYARGEATEDDLCAARTAASAADSAAARTAAWSAAWGAAWYAARSAAWAAALAADAWAAAWDVAGEAASAAAWADEAARASEREWQCNRLAEMLEEMK
jgi:hypothetical protein